MRSFPLFFFTNLVFFFIMFLWFKHLTVEKLVVNLILWIKKTSVRLEFFAKWHYNCLIHWTLVEIWPWCLSSIRLPFTGSKWNFISSHHSHGHLENVPTSDPFNQNKRKKRHISRQKCYFFSSHLILFVRCCCCWCAFRVFFFRSSINFFQWLSILTN